MLRPQFLQVLLPRQLPSDLCEATVQIAECQFQEFCFDG